MENIKVAIVEDKTEIRQGLQFLINGTPGFVCEHVFGSSEDALAVLNSSIADVVLMDIDLPGISGIECTSILKNKFPALQIIMLTIFEDSDKIFNALENGATGYLLKKTPPSRLLESIKEVLKGESPMSGEIARKVVESFGRKKENEKMQLLTSREKELLNLLSEGFRYKEIADKLFISIDTVRTHIRNIYEKLQVTSKIEAINASR